MFDGTESDGPSSRKNGLAPKTKSKKMAFDAEPSTCKFRLRLARYQTMVEEIATFIKQQGVEGGEKLKLLDVGLESGRSMRFIETIGANEHIAFYGIDNSTRRLASVYRSERWVLKQCDLEDGERSRSDWLSRQSSSRISSTTRNRTNYSQSWVTPMLLTAPFFLELVIEDLLFECILGV